MQLTHELVSRVRNQSREMAVKHDLILREECRLTVFEDRILSKKVENGEWRRLHNEKLHSLYRLSNIVKFNLKD